MWQILYNKGGTICKIGWEMIAVVIIQKNSRLGANILDSQTFGICLQFRKSIVLIIVISIIL